VLRNCRRTWFALSTLSVSAPFASSVRFLCREGSVSLSFIETTVLPEQDQSTWVSSSVRHELVVYVRSFCVICSSLTMEPSVELSSLSKLICLIMPNTACSGG